MSFDPDTPDAISTSRQEQRPYSAPTLIFYGDIQQLTQGSMGFNIDTDGMPNASQGN